MGRALGSEFLLIFLPMFRLSHFSFWILGHFLQRSKENAKVLRNLCLHFARQAGQDVKKWKGNHTTKVTKIQKTKKRKYGMNETKEALFQTLQHHS